MATYSDLAKQYSNRIKLALAKDGFTATSQISASNLRYSEILKELKAIKSDIDGLVYTESKKSLSENDKSRVLVDIQKELHLPNLRQMENLVESASNDDLSDLADTIENILKGGK